MYIIVFNLKLFSTMCTPGSVIRNQRFLSSGRNRKLELFLLLQHFAFPIFCKMFCSSIYVFKETAVPNIKLLPLSIALK